MCKEKECKYITRLLLAVDTNESAKKGPRRTKNYKWTNPWNTKINILVDTESNLARHLSLGAHVSCSRETVRVKGEAVEEGKQAGGRPHHWGEGTGEGWRSLALPCLTPSLVGNSLWFMYWVLNDVTAGKRNTAILRRHNCLRHSSQPARLS